MKIVVTASGNDLDAQVSPIFGRCPTFVFVDTETMAFDAVVNPALSAAGGAGIQAAQFVVERSVEAVLSGNVGPNAYNVLSAANVPLYLVGEGTVKQVVEAYKAGGLKPVGQANVQTHAGMSGWGPRGAQGGGRRGGGRA